MQSSLDAATIADKVARLDAAIDKSASWLRQNLPFHAGSYKSPCDDGIIDSGQYMLLPYAYEKAGRPNAAFDALSHSIEMGGPDGFGCVAPATLAKGSFIPYAPSWHAFTLCHFGRPDVARKILRHVLPYQARGAYGGFFDGPRQRDMGDGVLCFDSSCAAIIACLFAGELEAAYRGGAYLLRLDDLSTEGERVWTIRPDGSAVRGKSDAAWALHSAAPDPVTVCCTSRVDEPNSPHWKSGFYLAACAHLYSHTGDTRYRDAATKMARFARASVDAKGGWLLWGHKLAWGAAELYKVTADESALTIADELGEMMMRRQAADGTFPYREWFPQGDPTRITYSITAQCLIWMAKVKEALLMKARRSGTGAAAIRSRL